MVECCASEWMEVCGGEEARCAGKRRLCSSRRKRAGTSKCLSNSSRGEGGKQGKRGLCACASDNGQMDSAYCVCYKVCGGKEADCRRGRGMRPRSQQRRVCEGCKGRSSWKTVEGRRKNEGAKEERCEGWNGKKSVQSGRAHALLTYLEIDGKLTVSRVVAASGNISVV